MSSASAMICAACDERTEARPCAACGAEPWLAGRYQLEEPLGRSRHTSTWRATSTPDGADVVVKELGLRGVDPKIEALFRRECEVLAQLDHPAIPRLVETFETGRGRGRSLVLVEEYVPGEPLSQELERRRLSEPEALAVIEELLGILAWLHDLSPPVVHRDVKPANVVRRPDGRLALVDFGAVRDAIADSVGGGSTVAGTFGYMAPEQFRGDALPATDVYAVGALLVHLLSRRPPHELHDALGRFGWRGVVGASPATRGLLERFLDPDPSRRPATAREALGLLRAPPAPRPSARGLFTAVGMPRPVGARAGVVAALTVVAAALGLLGAAVGARVVPSGAPRRALPDSFFEPGARRPEFVRVSADIAAPNVRRAGYAPLLPAEIFTPFACAARITVDAEGLPTEVTRGSCARSVADAVGVLRSWDFDPPDASRFTRSAPGIRYPIGVSSRRAAGPPAGSFGFPLQFTPVVTFPIDPLGPVIVSHQRRDDDAPTCVVSLVVHGDGSLSDLRTNDPSCQLLPTEPVVPPPVGAERPVCDVAFRTVDRAVVVDGVRPSPACSGHWGGTIAAMVSRWTWYEGAYVVTVAVSP